MAQRTTSDQRQRRRDARERRRSLAAEPFEQADVAARKADQAKDTGKGADALKQAAATAVAGAVAAGIAGAAKAMRDRKDGGEDDGSGSGGGDPEGTQAEAPSGAKPEQQRAPAASDSVDGGDDGGGGEGEGGGGGGDRPDGEPGPPGQEQSEPEEDQPRGASTDDARGIVDKARRELEELLGAEPQSVSGFERSNGRWTVTLEVVEMRRIPESTDVLATYEVAFDDDRNLVSVTQKRRYRRSQVEEGR